MADIRAISISILAMLMLAPFGAVGLANAETIKGSAVEASQVINGDVTGITATRLSDGRWQLVGSGLSLTVDSTQWSRERWQLVNAVKVAVMDSAVKVKVTVSRNGRAYTFVTADKQWLKVRSEQPVYRDRFWSWKDEGKINIRERFTALRYIDAPHYREHNPGGLGVVEWAILPEPSAQVAFNGTPTPRPTQVAQTGGVVLKVEKSPEAKAIDAIAAGVANGTIVIK